MGYYDGRALAAYEQRLAQSCAHCDQRGVALRDEVLTCSTHDTRWEVSR